MGYPTSISQGTTVDNAIDHVVTYITYPNVDGSQDSDEKLCKTSFYFYSNHTNKSIKVKYLKVEGNDRTTSTVTLLPTLISEHESGRQQLSTRPEKIEGECDATVQIMEAWFVE